jgi:hypothetical protein
VLELTDGKKVPVVYDGVGKDTWLTSLDSVAPRGLVVSFGNASGAVDGVNLGILAAKGSLYVTRPTLATYANNAENLQRMADELFEMIISGKLTVDISQRYPLAGGEGTDRVVGATHDRVGCSVALRFSATGFIAGKPAPTGFGGEYKYCGHPKSLWELVCQRTMTRTSTRAHNLSGRQIANHTRILAPTDSRPTPDQAVHGNTAPRESACAPPALRVGGRRYQRPDQ